MEEGRSAFKMLTGTPAGKRSLGRLRRRWEDNITMDLKEMGNRLGLFPVGITVKILKALLPSFILAT